MAEIDAIQTEADLESQRLRVLQTSNQVAVSKFAILNLLSLDLKTDIRAKENLASNKVGTNIHHLLRVAFARRSDFQGQLYIVEQSRLGKIVAENEQLWDVSLFSRGRIGQVHTSGVPSVDIVDVTAGIRFDIQFEDLQRQQALVNADVQNRNAELQLEIIRSGVERQVRASASEVELLWRQIAVAERARDLARQAVAAEKLKLNAGRTSSFQVRFLEDALRISESQLLAAQVNYMNAVTRLDLQLGTTLDTWRIAVNES